MANAECGMVYHSRCAEPAFRIPNSEFRIYSWRDSLRADAERARIVGELRQIEKPIGARLHLFGAGLFERGLSGQQIEHGADTFLVSARRHVVGLPGALHQ